MPFFYSPIFFVNIKSIHFMLLIKFYLCIELQVSQSTGVSVASLSLFLRLENSTNSKSLTSQGHFSDSEWWMKRGLSPLPWLFIPSSTSFSSSSLPHPVCMSVSLCSFPNPLSHSSPSQKYPLSPPPLTCAPAGLPPPCWIKWTVPVSEDPCAPCLAQPGSATLTMWF